MFVHNNLRSLSLPNFINNGFPFHKLIGIIKYVHTLLQ